MLFCLNEYPANFNFESLLINVRMQMTYILNLNHLVIEIYMIFLLVTLYVALLNDMVLYKMRNSVVSEGRASHAVVYQKDWELISCFII